MWGNNAKKKVLVLNGSPKLNKSSTMVITNAFLEGMKIEEDIDLEIIHVQSLHVKPCIDCLSCWGRTEGECILKDDDVKMVKEKILNADIIIESFPLFFFSMPGVLKVLTDRLLSMMLTYRGHKPPEDGTSFHGLRYYDPNKRFIIISSCAYTEVPSPSFSIISAHIIALGGQLIQRCAAEAERNACCPGITDPPQLPSKQSSL